MSNFQLFLTRPIILCGLLGFLSILASCGDGSEKAVAKFADSDPFKNSIAPSQLFSINCDTVNIIESEGGIKILCPQNCFLDRKGKPFTGVAEIEIADALELGDIILSNLETTSNGEQLQSGGMLYFNASANGELLTINKDIPIHIEIPTFQKEPGMMAYRGIRDGAGNMNWIDPVPIKNYLTPVDISLLNFLPAHFYETVVENLPYKNHTIATRALVDSLYYSLSYINDRKLLHSLLPTDYNEPYLNNQAKVDNGVYTGKSYWIDSITSESLKNTYYLRTKGINPAIIKVLKSEQFQNTIIATYAFESRLQEIFKTCDNHIIELYINNLDQNLYVVDSMAAAYLGGDSTFLNFYREGLTNVRGADKNIETLNKYYAAQLKKVEAEIKQQADKLLKSTMKETETFKKTTEQYKKLLFKRETYRMETYGFEWTNTGWINVDKPAPKPEPINLSVTVINGDMFDRVYTYIILPTINSISRLNTSDNINFVIGNSANARLFIPKSEFQIIAVGYKGEEMFTALTTNTLKPVIAANLQLTATTKTQFKALLEPFQNHKRENNILVDLNYMQKMYQEEQRQKAIKLDIEVIRNLLDVAYPCRYYSRDYVN